MAKYRQIHTKIWKDTWFLELEPKYKLFFIYLFSNELASIAGIYELSERVMAFESGLPLEEVRAAFELFADAGKAYYEDGVVWVVKLRDYHETTSAQLQKGIQNELDDVKECNLKRRYMRHYGMVEPDPEPEEEASPAAQDIPFEGNGHSKEGISPSGEGLDRVSIGSGEAPSLVLSKYKSKSKQRARARDRPGEGEAWAAVLEKCDGDEDKAALVFTLERRIADHALWIRPSIGTRWERRDAMKEWWGPIHLVLAQCRWDEDDAFEVFSQALQRVRSWGSPSRPSGLMGEISKMQAQSQQGVGQELDAERAWAVVEEAFAKGDGRVLLDHPDVLAAVKAIGGWGELKHIRDRDTPFVKRRFAEAYSNAS